MAEEKVYYVSSNQEFDKDSFDDLVSILKAPRNELDLGMLQGTKLDPNQKSFEEKFRKIIDKAAKNGVALALEEFTSRSEIHSDFAKKAIHSDAIKDMETQWKNNYIKSKIDQHNKPSSNFSPEVFRASLLTPLISILGLTDQKVALLQSDMDNFTQQEHARNPLSTVPVLQINEEKNSRNIAAPALKRLDEQIKRPANIRILHETIKGKIQNKLEDLPLHIHVLEDKTIVLETNPLLLESASEARDLLSGSLKENSRFSGIIAIKKATNPHNVVQISDPVQFLGCLSSKEKSRLTEKLGEVYTKDKEPKERGKFDSSEPPKPDWLNGILTKKDQAPSSEKEKGGNGR